LLSRMPPNGGHGWTGGDREKRHGDVIARERACFGLRCCWRRRPSRGEMYRHHRTGPDSDHMPRRRRAGPRVRDNQTGRSCGTGLPGERSLSALWHGRIALCYSAIRVVHASTGNPPYSNLPYSPRPKTCFGPGCWLSAPACKFGRHHRRGSARLSVVGTKVITRRLAVSSRRHRAALGVHQPQPLRRRPQKDVRPNPAPNAARYTLITHHRNARRTRIIAQIKRIDEPSAQRRRGSA
jgi:hypothetical protein